MIIVRHRINTIKGLNSVPPQYGVELDIRATPDGRLILNHEPFAEGEDFEAYLQHWHHAFGMFNIKEAGVEDRVHALAVKYQIKNYFVFDLETPYLWKVADTPAGKHAAVRFSEDECIHTALAFKSRIGWVWIDTKTRFPLDQEVVEQLHGFKTALVCPERWGRPDDIPAYIARMKELNFKLDLVMTAAPYVTLWEQSGL